MKPRVKSLLTVAAVLAGVACLTAGGDWPEPKKPQGPFGEPVRGAKLGLRAPIWLRVGQPLEVQPPEVVFARVPLPPGTKYLPGENILNGDDLPKYSLELTDANGQVVAFRVEPTPHPDWPLLDPLDPIRLWPTEAHARGRYWKPGIYQLRAVYEKSRNPMQPYGWYGKLVSNTVRVEIVEPDTPVPSALRDPKIRKRVEDAINDFDSLELATREGGQDALVKLGLVALPMIDAALAKVSGTTRKRLEGVLKSITRPYTERITWEMPEPLGAFLAGFDDDTWNTLKKHLAEPSHWFTNKPPKDWYGVRRARYAPVLTLSEKELVKMLEHAEPEMRILALRSLPRSNDPATLEKLVACLDDSYVEYDGGISGHVFADYPVAQDAQEAIVFQGQKIVPLLLRLAKKERPEKRGWAPWSYRKLITPLLGRIGPSKEAGAFLEEMLRREELEDRGLAVSALGEWGRTAVPRLLKLAGNDKEDARLRGSAVAHLGKFGTPQEVGHCLLGMLRRDLPSDVTSTTIEAIRKLRLRDALPELQRISFDDRVAVHARQKAVQAIVLLGRKEEVSKLLQALLEPGVPLGLQIHAVYYLGHMKDRSAVPKLLGALEDETQRLRGTADVALRAIADLPEGVGYQPKAANADVWRKWWERQK